MPVTSLTEATISQSITPEQAQTIATNTAGITANANNIATNAAAILTNSQRLDGFASQIEALGTTIASNTEAINDLEGGLAAVAALPDMFLARDESIAASGGIGIYGGEVGFGGTLAIRGNANWSFGASAGFGGDEATGKLQVRWAK